MKKTLSPARSPWIAAAAALLTAACGWQYAEERVGERAKPDPITKVVVIETPKAREDPPAPTNDPCEESASFTIVRIEGERRTLRQLSCDEGRIISESTEDLGDIQLRQLRAENMPLAAWFLLVDPAEPFRKMPETISNKHLMALNARFALRYHQRVPDKGLIIYRFEELSFKH